MVREVRKIGLAGLILIALCHAWFGHDLVHGHHHQDGHHNHGHAHQAHQSADEATHTKAVCRPDSNVFADLAPVALLIGFCDFSLPDPVELIGCLEFKIELGFDAEFLERPHSPRAPPAFSSIV